MNLINFFSPIGLTVALSLAVLVGAVEYEHDFRTNIECTTSTGTMHSLAMGNDGAFYAVGMCSNSNLWVYKYKVDTLLWNFIVPTNNTYYTPVSVCVNSNNEVLTAADVIIRRSYISSSLDTLLITKYTSDGDLVWEWHLESKYIYVYAGRIKTLANGNYATVGWYSNYWHVVVISDIPEMIWKMESLNSSSSNGLVGFEETSDRSLLTVTGKRYTSGLSCSISCLSIKYNAYGDITYIRATRSSVCCSDITKSVDGGYLIIGWETQKNAWIYKLSAAEEYEWDLYLVSASDNYAVTVSQKADGEITLVAFKVNNELWIVTLDSDGNFLDIVKEATTMNYPYDGIVTGNDLVATVGTTYGFIKISCPFGNYYSYTLASCTPCDVMTYQDKKDQDFCNACPDGEYQDEPGQTECKPCSDFCLSCTLATNCFQCVSYYYLFTEGSDSSCKRKFLSYPLSVHQ